MKITEYCDALNINMRIEYKPNADRGWRVRIDGAEVKENKSSVVACSEFGTGNTPEEAIADYVSLIKGKRLVINGLSANRQEYSIPNYIE